MKQKKLKKERIVKCPKCGYSWKTKQRGYICCSRCKDILGGIILKMKKYLYF